MKWILLVCLTFGLSMASCKDYDDDISSLNTTNASYKTQIDALNTAKTGLEAQIATLNADKGSLAKAEAALTAIDKLKADLAAANTGGTASIAEVNTKLATLSGRVDAIAGVIATLQTTVDASAASQLVLKNDLTAAVTKLGELDQKLALVATQQEALSMQYAALSKYVGYTNDATAKTLVDRVKALEATVGVGTGSEDLDAITTWLGTNLTEFKDLNAAITALNPGLSTLGSLLSHRLTSIEYIADEHINGIAAIKFYSLSYMPQVFKAHTELYPTTVNVGTTLVTLATDNKEVRYRMNPRMGVQAADLKLPTFDCIVSTNDMTKSVEAGSAGVNTPIKPVGSLGTIGADGIYTLLVTKAIDKSIDREWLNVDKTKEKFYMASLNVPIAKSGLTDEEIKAGATPSVHSEYVRIAEQIVTPFIKQTGSLATGSHNLPNAVGPYADLNAIDINGKYLHYHDSTTLYKSGVSELIDYNVEWNKPFDLKKIVDVCIVEEDHKSLEDYKAYGLEYRFALPKAEYMQGTNNTDQQRFAKIDDPKNGILTSQVYTIGGATQTAIGREPIVRAMLVDTKNNKLVAIRYIKLKFATPAPSVKPLDDYTFPTHDISCENVVMRFGTQEMNELVYRKLEEVGLSKITFHALYDGVAISKLTQDGTDITDKNILAEPLTKATYVNGVSLPGIDYTFGMIPDVNDNTSYNLVWTMTPKAIATLKKVGDDYASTYELTFKFTSSKGGDDISMKFIVKIEAPKQAFNYQGTYWNNGQYGIFNVNPIVYDTPTAGSVATAMKDYSHIEADLVNGYVYGATKNKPANLAQFIQKIRYCAKVNFVFDATRFSQYSHLAGYKVDGSATQLWKTTVGVPVASGAATTPQIDAPLGEWSYVQANNMAASINNAFGATALENYNKNLAYDQYNEVLQSGVNEAKGVIRLHETDKSNGTPAAQALIGKKVPVNLVVEYNMYNKIPVQKFEVFFIDPLKMSGNLTGAFIDAVINGSYLDAQKGLTFTDWDDYVVAKAPIAAIPPATTVPDKAMYAVDLWAYYAVNSVAFDVANVKSNLDWVGNTLLPTAGVENGPLPTNRSLKQVIRDAVTGDYTVVTADPTHLGYYNNGGTPVNVDYKLFVPVTVKYKWGVISKSNVSATVTKAGGTPVN